jgi:hypothetical protein
MHTRARRAVSLLLVVAVGVATGCGQAGEGAPLEVQNGTTIAVWLVVNGRLLRVIPARADRVEIPASEVGRHPWRISLRTATGRELLSATFEAGSVRETTGPGGEVLQTGSGARADLSCGRLDVWSGPPMLGPAPDGGMPGDCAP